MGGLTDVSCHLQIPRRMGLYPGPLEKGGLELSPTRNNSSSLPRGGDQSPILSSG